MRILLLVNNWVGWQITSWLKERGDEIAGLVIHPPHKRKYGDEIIRSAGVDPVHIFDGSKLHEPDVLKAIETLQPDIGLSIFFGYFLTPRFIDLFREGVINLHPAYLPYNRGAYPNVWSIIEGTPAGVSLHYVDAGMDTGDVITQRRVRVEPVDTGATLYKRLEHTCIELFQETWPLIISRQAPRIPQDKEKGTYHGTKDVDQIDAIDLGRTYTARQLINIIQARTFPPHRGAYFINEGRKVYLRLQLFYEGELSETDDEPVHRN